MLSSPLSLYISWCNCTVLQLMTDFCHRKLAYIDVYQQNVWLMIVYLQDVSEAPDGCCVRNTSMQQQSKVCQQNKNKHGEENLLRNAHWTIISPSRIRKRQGVMCLKVNKTVLLLKHSEKLGQGCLKGNKYIKPRGWRWFHLVTYHSVEGYVIKASLQEVSGNSQIHLTNYLYR